MSRVGLKFFSAKTPIGVALRVAGLYGVLGFVWIVYSDHAVQWLFADPNAQATIQTYKGLFWIFLTTGLIYAVSAYLVANLVREAEGRRKMEYEVIERLSMAAEYRDDETGNHVRRVGAYCAILARGLGMSEERAKLLEMAACLHDIGKIGIPDEVLLKPGPFNDEDRQTMRAHTLIGSSLLAGGESEVLRLAESIALTHHERWDGTGYPAGLVGEEIPIEGRICAIADVFDALVTKRRYKDEWSTEDAVEELRSLSGVQFDPQLVALLELKLPEIEAVRDAFPDFEACRVRYQRAA